ncbi:hypothetical protein LX87_05242 [Larkinella arboricola]|uniref:Lipoprotein n=1 Tax=Larkinella arboricola TaxID=643671 RepID=A0A327WKH8_LARAB|nr:hypothetical protein [Larkinella arboricola]RAJ92273.1 hypothetical protein LX87_05242 [Larkinella arboricola]
MKKIGLMLLVLASLSGCKDKEASPSLGGTFTGPMSVEDNVGVASYSNADVTVKQVGTSEVEVSGRGFTTFVIDNVVQQANSYYLADQGESEFRYSGNSSPKTLLVNWTAQVNGKTQTIRFGGNKKK